MIVRTHTRLVCIFAVFGFVFLPPRGSAQGLPASEAGENKTETTPNQEPPGGKRIFGVLPNYRTVDGALGTGPLTVSQKFAIANKDSFDYPLVLLAAGLGGIGQWTNQNPSFGQGMGGFSKRFVTGFADQSIGNIMTEGLFPSILHEDPRYYRRGTGGTWSRTAYAFSRLFVTKTDSGGQRFNYSEWGGNAAATAISNIYYLDGKTVGANTEKLGMQIGLDGLGLVLKEFWPDIKRAVFERHRAAPQTH
jgi:hypothetical protein